MGIVTATNKFIAAINDSTPAFLSVIHLLRPTLATSLTFRAADVGDAQPRPRSDKDVRSRSMSARRWEQDMIEIRLRQAT